VKSYTRVKKRVSFDLIVVVVSCVLYGAIALLPFKAKPLGDLDFHNQAKQFAQFLWGMSDYNSLVINKAPGPVLFFIPPYFLAGPNATDTQLWFSGILWTFLFMTLCMILLRKAGRNFGYETAGKVTIVALLLLPLHLYYSLGILAEGLAFVGCCVFVYGWSRIVSEKNFKVFSQPWILFCAGLLAMLLARPNSILILPILGLILLIYGFWKKQSVLHEIRFVFLKALALLTIALLVITVWVRSLPANSESSNQEGYLSFVMMIGRYQFRNETWDWRFWDDDKRADSQDYKDWQITQQRLNKEALEKNTPVSSIYYKYEFADIAEHPLTSIKQTLVRVLFGHVLQVNSVNMKSFGVGPVKGPLVYWTFHVIINLFNGSLIILAVYFLISRSFNPRYLVMFTPWVSLVAFHSIVYMEQRYLFPARPIILLGAAIVIVELVQKKYLVKKVSDAT
jgi:hypothetical protein